LTLAPSSYPASFFGESHLEVPVATALTNINLELQFSTAQPEALLLLAAGQADHLLLQLHSGHLQVSDALWEQGQNSFSSSE
jgi:chondroitin sulfate proteoglycan 4